MKREGREFDRAAKLLDQHRAAAVDLSVSVTAAARSVQARYNQDQVNWTGVTGDDLTEVDAASARLGMLSDQETRDAANQLVRALVAYIESRFSPATFPAIGDAEDRLIVSVNRELRAIEPHF